jgi:hypothetical protein
MAGHRVPWRNQVHVRGDLCQPTDGLYRTIIKVVTPTMAAEV